MRHNKIVAFDVDGVTRDLLDSIFNFIYDNNKELYDKYDLAAMSSWDVKSCVKKEYDADSIDREFSKYVFDTHENCYRIYRNATVHSDAENFKELYYQLKQCGYKVAMLTSQKNAAQRIATIEWLDEHGIMHDHLLFVNTPDKQIYGVNYHLDDNVKVTNSVNASGNNGVLLKRWFNTDDVKLATGKVVDSIPAYVEHVLNN